MIRNERQYKITKSQAEGFRRSYDQLRADTESAGYKTRFERAANSAI